MATKKDKKTISIFVSHRGCPNDCVFCNQRKITGVEKPLTEEEIVLLIEESLQTIDTPMVEIAFFGGSFTAIKKEEQLLLLKIAKRYIDAKKVQHIRISTRPDAISEEKLQYLWDYGVRVIELGVQSMDEQVLAAANRGHDTQCVYKSSELILKKGFKLGLQMMIGLPADNEEKIMSTVEKFINIKPDFVRIYPVLVIKETGLESLFENKKYIPLSLEEAIKISARAYKSFCFNQIEVIRIGLQASETVALGAQVVAGPFHPAFGEMVYARIFRDLIEDHLQKNKKDNQKNLFIKVSQNRISQLLGNKKSNIKYFEEKYKILIKVSVSEKQNFLQLGEETVDLTKIFIQ